MYQVGQPLLQYQKIGMFEFIQKRIITTEFYRTVCRDLRSEINALMQTYTYYKRHFSYSDQLKREMIHKISSCVIEALYKILLDNRFNAMLLPILENLATTSQNLANTFPSYTSKFRLLEDICPLDTELIFFLYNPFPEVFDLFRDIFCHYASAVRNFDPDFNLGINLLDLNI